MLAKVGRLYESSFRHAPYLTLAVVNGILSCTGDSVAQLLPSLLAGETTFDFDLSRSGRFWLFGTTMGPVAGKWNEVLEMRFPLKPLSEASPPPVKLSEKPKPPLPSPAGHVLDMSKGARRSPSPFSPAYPAQSSKGANDKAKSSNRTMIVQAMKRVMVDQTVMAPLGLIIFFTYMGILEGLEWSEIESRLNTLYFKILLVNWQVWPFIQLFNFRFMPLRLRVPFGAACGILWTVFLSFTTRPLARDVEQLVANPATGSIPKAH